MRRIVVCLPVAAGLFAFAAAAQTPEGTPASTSSAPATASTSAKPEAPPAPAAAAPAASEAPRTYLESSTIVVDGKAEYNGSIEFEFTPLGSAGKTFDVTVLAKTGKKDIAKDVHKELVIAAGSLYKVKLSGAEVRVSKASKTAQNFAIVIRKLNVSGVSVLVKKG